MTIRYVIWQVVVDRVTFTCFT